MFFLQMAFLLRWKRGQAGTYFFNSFEFEKGNSFLGGGYLSSSCCYLPYGHSVIWENVVCENLLSLIFGPSLPPIEKVRVTFKGVSVAIIVE